ncbi:MAG: 2Fe-2S iron-sulfur cluster-binding protein, partial [bacterium]
MMNPDERFDSAHSNVRGQDSPGTPQEVAIMALVRIKIDGRELEAEEGKTILQAAQENGIDIPTLCNH